MRRGRDIAQIKKLRRELMGFLGQFDDCFGRSEPRKHVRIHVRGPLPARRPVEPVVPCPQSSALRKRERRRIRTWRWNRFAAPPLPGSKHKPCSHRPDLQSIRRPRSGLPAIGIAIDKHEGLTRKRSPGPPGAGHRSRSTEVACAGRPVTMSRCSLRELI